MLLLRHCSPPAAAATLSLLWGLGQRAEREWPRNGQRGLHSDLSVQLELYILQHEWSGYKKVSSPCPWPALALALAAPMLSNRAEHHIFAQGLDLTAPLSAALNSLPLNLPGAISGD